MPTVVPYQIFVVWLMQLGLPAVLCALAHWVFTAGASYVQLFILSVLFCLAMNEPLSGARYHLGKHFVQVHCGHWLGRSTSASIGMHPLRPGGIAGVCVHALACSGARGSSDQPSLVPLWFAPRPEVCHPGGGPALPLVCFYSCTFSLLGGEPTASMTSLP